MPIGIARVCRWRHHAPVRIALAAATAFALAAAGCSSGHRAASPDPNTSIDVTGAIGGIRAHELRASVERVLGPGAVLSRVVRPGPPPYTLIRVRYPASGLGIWYDQARGEPAQVAAIFTTSPRYHTADGLRVGSTLAEARREPGIQCDYQPGYLACQGGLGYQRPVTSFTVRDGRVVRVFMVAVAD
jgi:hypothetical protein